jgi:predicted acylesterase/phospholipase RssA
MDASTDDAPKDRFCDLVMKGGITSGVVYPKAIDLLSHRYRFKSIGGTSAGAIAAAVTAAAEYNRRQNDSRAGFELLSQLPEKLQARVPGTENSKLLSLFQPQVGTRRLFSVLVRSLNRGGTFRRIFSVIAGLLVAYWPVTALVVLAALAVHLAGGPWLAALPLLLIALVLGIGACVYWDLTRRLVANGFGMCTGMAGASSTHEALTPWLHALIQKAAGLEGKAPLTFGALWSARGFPPSWRDQGPGETFRSIDLQMFATNLGHGRPYIFPLRETSQSATRFREHDRLYFKEEELKPYLPDDVLAHMIDHSKPYEVEPGREGKDPAVVPGMRQLPEPKDFPVLLAARMSLSFPLLFAAVPLWAIDHNAPHGRREFRRCWFSDGGISSNFPMHLFDGLVPSWPTFGINLEPEIAGRERVYLPQSYDEGHGERWFSFDERKSSSSRFGGFLSSILSVMQNWNDNALSRMPGVRDRIARVRLSGTEGGLNLNMEASTIAAVSARGAEAAQALLARFAAADPKGPQAEGWDEQRLVRLGLLLKMIEARGPGVLNAMSPNCGHATALPDLIRRATARPGDSGKPPPPGYEEPLTPEQEGALHEVLGALGTLVALLVDRPHGNPFKPVPHPELRVRPPL